MPSSQENNGDTVEPFHHFDSSFPFKLSKGVVITVAISGKGKFKDKITKCQAGRDLMPHLSAHRWKKKKKKRSAEASHTHLKAAI